MTVPQTWLGMFVPAASEDLPPKESDGGELTGGEGEGWGGIGDGDGDRRAGLREGGGRGEVARREAAAATSASALARRCRACVTWAWRTEMSVSVILTSWTGTVCRVVPRSAARDADAAWRSARKPTAGVDGRKTGRG